MTDVTTWNQLANEIHALQEENERLKAELDGASRPPCAWCKGDWTDNFSVMDENFAQPVHNRIVKHCPFCGRRLS